MNESNIILDWTNRILNERDQTIIVNLTTGLHALQLSLRLSAEVKQTLIENHQSAIFRLLGDGRIIILN